MPRRAEGPEGTVDEGRASAFAARMRDEFPGFDILPKHGSALQRAIHTALVIVTFGGMRTYLTRYHTVLFGKLWVPSSRPNAARN